MRNVRDLRDAAEKCRKDGDHLGHLFYKGAVEAATEGKQVVVWDERGRRTVRRDEG